MIMANDNAGNKIQVRDLNFYYGKFHALKNISLDIAKNKVTAFIGPSGCGKSTLLRTFNKMYELYGEQRAEGEILLDGNNILTDKQDIALLRAKVGMVFQNQHLSRCQFMTISLLVYVYSKNCLALIWMNVFSGL